MQIKFLPVKVLCLLLVFSSNILAQQQPENPGFELWEEFGIGPDTLEPVDWSSLKSSDGGELINMVIPQVWEQSTDAHSGLYAVKLINMPILSFVAPGTLTNGRVHATLPPTDAYVYTIDDDPQWYTPFTEMPDSLTAWAKYFPQSTDIAHIFAVLHTDTAKIFDASMTNWVAVANIDISQETGEWTQFSAPFTYLNGETPEFILFGIFVGDAENSTVGSILYIDDIELIYHETGQEKVINNNPYDIYVSGSQLVLRCEPNDIKEESTLEILDNMGRIAWKEQFSPESLNTFDLDISPGIYICRISGRNHFVAKKIVVR